MYAAIQTRRVSSKGVLGALRDADAPPVPLACRRWTAAGPTDKGVVPWRVTRRVDVPDPALWQRTADTSTEHVEVHRFDDGWYQHYVVVPAGYTTIWARIEFQLAERIGDDRTRVFAVSDQNGQLLLGVYFNAGQIELRDEVAANSVFGGTTDVSEIWRRLKVQVVEDSGAGDGILRVWLDGAATADVEMTNHTAAVVGQRLLFGLGSVGTLNTKAQHTMRLANLELFAADPEPKAAAVSTDWAAAAPFQEVVDPLSAIQLSPDPMSAQDGATSGTVIGTLSRTGGRGDGTWSLTGGLATIAEIVGTEVRLTTTVDTATHDGTTGTIGYSGDSAGGSVSDITTSLGVSSASTNLTLTATAGGAQQQGTLDTSSPFQRLQMMPQATPWMASQPAGNGVVTDLGYAGSITRCGLDGIAQASDAAIIHVTSLSGGDEVGTIRWAASTNTDNRGNDISGKPCIVVFDVSGHVSISGNLHFNKPNRWFAGQTAPRAANGSGGIYIHGWVGGREVRASNVIIEHMRFLGGDDRVTSNDVLTVGGSSSDRHDIVLRNCAFYWGVDETLACAPSWSDKARVEHMTVIDCINAEPAYFKGTKDVRGKAWFIKYGMHRLEATRNFVAGAKGRPPGLKPFVSLALLNHYMYDCQYPVLTMWMSHVDWWGGKYSALDPTGITCYHVGGQFVDGPGWSAENRSAMIQHFDLKDADASAVMRHYWADEIANGALAQYPARNKHSFWDVATEALLWPRQAPLPSEDAEAFLYAHCGPWPGDRSACERRIMDTWQAGGSLVFNPLVDGRRRSISEFPDEKIATTTGQPPDLPANPFDTDTNGLTVIENWLEQKHVERGGAPYHQFGRWLRFPWGGRVKVEKDGTATFDPKDMPAGSQGLVEITRADGSVVTARCEAN